MGLKRSLPHSSEAHLYGCFVYVVSSGSHLSIPVVPVLGAPSEDERPSPRRRDRSRRWFCVSLRDLRPSERETEIPRVWVSILRSREARRFVNRGQDETQTPGDVHQGQDEVSRVEERPTRCHRPFFSRWETQDQCTRGTRDIPPTPLRLLVSPLPPTPVVVVPVFSHRRRVWCRLLLLPLLLLRRLLLPLLPDKVFSVAANPTANSTSIRRKSARKARATITRRRKSMVCPPVATKSFMRTKRPRLSSVEPIFPPSPCSPCTLWSGWGGVPDVVRRSGRGSCRGTGCRVLGGSVRFKGFSSRLSVVTPSGKVDPRKGFCPLDLFPKDTQPLLCLRFLFPLPHSLTVGPL